MVGKLTSFFVGLTEDRVMRDLQQRSYIGIFFLAFIGGIIFFTYDFNSRHPELVNCFLGPLVTICVFRGLHLAGSQVFSEKFPLTNTIVFVLSVMATAITWGYGFVSIMMITDEYQTQMLMSIVTAGICSAGVVAYVPSRFMSLSYNACIMWPAATYMVLYSNSRTAGFLFFLYSAYLSIITIKGNLEYWKAIRNEELLRKQSLELEVLSKVDVLTGLFNRRYFEEIFTQEWKKAARNEAQLTILVCDIDNFKLVNDEYGHLAGDEVLRATAANLGNVFKRVTDIICRYGGEEFVILLTISAGEACVLAEQMCRLQRQTTIKYGKKQIRTTISIGLASVTPHFTKPKEDLFGLADQALYQAKNSGKNRVVVAA